MKKQLFFGFSVLLGMCNAWSQLPPKNSQNDKNRQDLYPILGSYNYRIKQAVV